MNGEPELSDPIEPLEPIKTPQDAEHELFRQQIEDDPSDENFAVYTDWLKEQGEYGQPYLPDVEFMRERLNHADYNSYFDFLLGDIEGRVLSQPAEQVLGDRSNDWKQAFWNAPGQSIIDGLERIRNDWDERGRKRQTRTGRKPVENPLNDYIRQFKIALRRLGKL